MVPTSVPGGAVPAIGGQRRRTRVGGRVGRAPAAGGAVTRLRGIRPTWTQHPVEGPWRGQAQYRAHGTPVDATIALAGGELVVDLDTPATGIAPGQSVVVFDGDRVVGSATLADAR